MATVDNKVVSLEFNNSRFEKNVSSTMSALDKLKDKLSFKGATKGFSDIQASADKIQMNNVSRGIEGVSAGFIAMSTVAITALSRITSSAMDAGGRIANALTLKPVTDGFGEYETKMGSFQTIMSNTQAEMDKAGSSQQEWGNKVTKSLQDLNTYADQTIYNFGEMTRNIGTFTAAGVDLDTSVSAIKGIANIAAISGSNSQQASTAMYQLSQALASGSVKLMDWNSVVNAGMGGEVFQKSLFDTGKALGTLTDVPVDQTFDEWKAAGNTFRDSLQEEWITADVLTTTLGAASGELSKVQLMAKGFTEDQADAMVRLGQNGVAAATEVKTATQLVGTIQEAMGSGWATTWELIIGDFGEAKNVFTNISNAIGGVIGKSADARNEMMLEWKKEGGRKDVFAGLIYAVDALLSVIRPIKEAFRSVFPKRTSEDLLKLSESFKNFFKNLKIGEGTAKTIKTVFTAFFSILKGAFSVVVIIGKAFFTLVGAVGSFASALVSATGGALGRFWDALMQLKTAIFGGGGVGGAVSDGLSGIGEAAQKLGSFIGGLFTNLDKVTSKIAEFAAKLQNSKGPTDESGESVSRFAGAIQWLKDRLSGIGNFFKSIFGGITSFGEMIRGFFTSIKEGLSGSGGGITDLFSNVFQKINWNTVIGGVGVGAGAVLVNSIRKFLADMDWKNLVDDLKEMLQGISDGITEVLDAAGEALKAFTLKTKSEAIMKIAIAVAVLTAALVVLASIDPQRLLTAGIAMGAIFVALNTSMKGLMSLELPTGAKMAGLAAAMIGMAAAILLLSIAMNRLKNLDNGDIAAGLLVIIGLMAGLSAAAESMNENSGKMLQAGIGMIGMAAAVLVLSHAIEKLAAIDPWRAVVGTGVAVSAIVAMAEALKRIDEKQAKAKGFAFLSMGLAVNLFARAVDQFGNMKLSALGTGMAAIAAILGGLVIFFNKLPSNVSEVAVQILIISGALVVMSVAIERFGSMDWGTLGKGLLGIAGALLIMAGAAQVMNTAIVGAGAILVVSVALMALAAAVSTFGQMGVDTMIKSIVGIGAALLVIAGAAALMGYISPLILAGGVAFAVLGAAMLMFGAGAWLAASAIVALAGSSAAGTAAAVASLMILAKALPMLLGAFLDGLIESMPKFVELGVSMINALLDGLLQVLPKIFEVVDILVSGIVDLVRNKAPEIILLGLTLVQGLLESLREKASDFAKTGLEILGAFINGILEGLPGYISSVVDGLIEFMQGLAEVIRSRSQELGDAGRDLALAILEGMINVFVPEALQEAIGNVINGMISWFKNLLGISSPSTVFLEFGGDILDGLVNGLKAGASAVWNFIISIPVTILGFMANALTWLVQKGKDIISGLWNGAKAIWSTVSGWVAGLAGRFVRGIGVLTSTLLQKGKDIIQGLWNGAKNIWTSLYNWVTMLPGKVVSAVGDLTNKLKSAGKDLIQGLKNGISDKWEEVKTWLKEKAEGLLDVVTKPWEILSPSRVMMDIGENFIAGLNIGMAGEWKNLESDTSKNAMMILDAVQNATKSAKGLEFLDGLSPTITPVLDLSLVEAKARTLGDILGIGSLSTDLSYGSAQQIATTRAATDELDAALGGGDTYLNFVQNNNAPKALSTGDIYRGTKSQIALARKELGLANR